MIRKKCFSLKHKCRYTSYLLLLLSKKKKTWSKVVVITFCQNEIFWKIAWVKTLTKHDYYMDKLWEISISVAFYQKKINLVKYCYVYIPQSCYKINTNNMIKVVNNRPKLEYSQSVIKLLNFIWHKIMTKIFYIDV